jgi:hypothetical protein
MGAGVLPVICPVTPDVTGGLMNIGPDMKRCSNNWRSGLLLRGKLPWIRDENDEAERHGSKGIRGSQGRHGCLQPALTFKTFCTQESETVSAARNTTDGGLKDPQQLQCDPSAILVTDARVDASSQRHTACREKRILFDTKNC